MARININGDKLNIPDGLTPDQMDSVVEDFVWNTQAVGSPIAEPQAESPGLFSRIGSDIKRRGQQSREAQAAYEAGDQGLLRTRAQQFGLAGAGTISDIAGEGLTSAYKTVVPPFMQEDISKGLGVIGKEVMATPVGDALKSGAQEAAQFAKENPGRARDVEALFNVATMIPVGTGAKAVASEAVAPAVTAIGKQIPKAMNAAKAGFEAKKINSMLPHVLPKETPGQIAETITQRKLGGGLRNKVIYVPKESEKFMAKVALDVGIKNGEPIVKSVQKANFAIGKEAKQLKAALEKSNVVIEPAKFNQMGVSIAEKIAKNPLIDENSATVKKILEAAQDAINSNPKTPAGVLQARIDFDKAITKFQPTAFNQDAPATAFRFSKDQVRQGFNQLVADSVPDAVVKQSLAKQSSLYDIIENLGSKAGEQGKLGQGRISRFLDTPAGKITKYGAIAGGSAVVGGKVVGGIAAGTQ